MCSPIRRIAPCSSAGETRNIRSRGCYHGAVRWLVVLFLVSIGCGDDDVPPFVFVDGRVSVDASLPPDAFTDVPIPAGTYVLQIPTVSVSFGGGDVDSYTIQLSTAP